MKHDRNLAGERYERLYRDAMIKLALKEGRMKLDKNNVAVPAWKEKFAKVQNKPRQSEPGSKIWDQILGLLRRKAQPMIRARIRDYTHANTDTIQRSLDKMVAAGLVEIITSKHGNRQVLKYAAK